MKNILTMLIPNAHTRDKITDVLFNIFFMPMRFLLVHIFINAISFTTKFINIMPYYKFAFETTKTLFDMESSWRIFVGENLNIIFDLPYDEDGNPLF